MLYDLLGRMYSLTLELDASVDRENIVRQIRVELATKWNIKTQDNTSDATALVRYITRADRKTAHVYARVIEVAKANQVKAPYLSGFIERQGGIEKIRAKNVLVGTSIDVEEAITKERLQLTREYIEARKECPYSSFKVGNKFNDLDEPDALNFFVCSERDGRYYVLAKLPVTEGQSRDLIEGLANQVCQEMTSARVVISNFSKKAHKKSAGRIRRGLIRKFPSLKNRFGKKKQGPTEVITFDSINSI